MVDVVSIRKYGFRFAERTEEVGEVEAEAIWESLTNQLYGYEAKRVMKRSLMEYTRSVAKLAVKVQDLGLPIGFKEIGREEVDSKFTNGPTLFIYAKNENSEYGFRVINGEQHPFSRLGAIEDARSTIGSLFESIPEGKILVTSDFLNLKINDTSVRNFLGGRRLKAAIAILTLEGYLKKVDRQVNRRGAFGYYKVSYKMTKMGFEDNGKTIESPSSTEAMVNTSPRVTIASKGGLAV